MRVKTLAIVGASGHGKVVLEVAMAVYPARNIVFFDDSWPQLQTIMGHPILGDTDYLCSLGPSNLEVIVAIGNNKVRLMKQRLLESNGFSIASIIHPFAIVSNSAKIGSGSVVMAGAVINADAVIGQGVIINTNAVVEHECSLANGVHISPGACLAGGVIIGEESWVGIGAVIIQQKSIGKNVVVGAGSVVLNNFMDDVIVAGVPAEIIRTVIN